MTELCPLGSGTCSRIEKAVSFRGCTSVGAKTLDDIGFTFHPWVRWIIGLTTVTSAHHKSTRPRNLPTIATKSRTSRSTIRFLHIPEVVVFKICCSVVCSFVHFMFLSIMAFSLDTISLCEAAYVSVLMVVFIVLAFVCKRKTWMWFGMTTASVFGVALIVVPVYLLKVQVSYYVWWYFMTALG